MSNDNDVRWNGAGDARSLERLLIHGSEASRRHLAEYLLSDGSSALIGMLVSTVRSDELWRLRARSLEVLGMVAATGDEQRARSILDALTGAMTGDVGR